MKTVEEIDKILMEGNLSDQKKEEIAKDIMENEEAKKIAVEGALRQDMINLASFILFGI